MVDDLQWNDNGKDKYARFIQTFSFFYSADKDAQKGKKTARKTTRAGGSGMDLQKVAEEQQTKLVKERAERKEQIKAAAAAPPPEAPPAAAPIPAEPEATKDAEPSKNADRNVYETP